MSKHTRNGDEQNAETAENGRERTGLAGGATGDQCHGESGDGGGFGPINPHDPPTGFSAHREPREVGGKRYWKCQYCGVESIWWNERDMTSQSVHKDFCGHPDVGDRPEVMTDGGVDVSQADIARRETDHERAARKLHKSIPGPEPMKFPDGWRDANEGGSWHRAQVSPSHVSPNGPAEFSVLLGYPNTNEVGDRHRVIFAILDGQLVTRCDCDGYQHRSWCAHVALLWWRWTQRNLSVVDLNTGRTWTSVPSWLSVDDRDVEQHRSLSRPHVAADGGGRS